MLVKLLNNSAMAVYASVVALAWVLVICLAILIFPIGVWIRDTAYSCFKWLPGPTFL